MRLLLAGMVIMGHTWLGGRFAGKSFTNSLGTWAVYGFFAISGYLIAGSRLRTGFGTFMLRRAARVLPGFWVCLLVTAFCAAPLISAILGSSYEIRAGWGVRLGQLAAGLYPALGGRHAFRCALAGNDQWVVVGARL